MAFLFQWAGLLFTSFLLRQNALLYSRWWKSSRNNRQIMTWVEASFRRLLWTQCDDDRFYAMSSTSISLPCICITCVLWAYSPWRRYSTVFVEDTLETANRIWMSKFNCVFQSNRQRGKAENCDISPSLSTLSTPSKDYTLQFVDIAFRIWRRRPHMWRCRRMCGRLGSLWSVVHKRAWWI